MTDHIPKVGDIGFARTRGAMGWLIRVGTWLKFRKSEYNHEFVVWKIENDVPYIIQATIHGVTNTARLDEVAPGGTYTLISPPPEVDIDKFIEFCCKQVGVEYGILTILAIASDLLSWNWVPALRGVRKNSWICTAVINEGLRFSGWYHDWIDIYNILPDEGYNALVSTGAKAFAYGSVKDWPYYSSPIPSHWS